MLYSSSVMVVSVFNICWTPWGSLIVNAYDRHVVDFVYVEIFWPL